MHVSSLALWQLQRVVSGGGGIGSVMGVCGGVMASVAPTRAIARRIMSAVELGDGSVRVIRRMDVLVAVWASRVLRSMVTDRDRDGGMWYVRWASAAGVLRRVCSISAAICRLRAKQ